jgi:hypothetical protein
MDILTDAGPRSRAERRGSNLIEDVRTEGDALADFVELPSAGDHGDGAYRCAECRYGICVRGELPSCPMCAGRVWEPVSLPALHDEPLRRA